MMGTLPVSGECHSAMSNILQGLKGVIQIKDDIILHGKGQEHEDNLRACLTRLYEYGIRLRREKCKLGRPEIMWFGHIFSKQGMSPDPPTSKEEVKSFLQIVQFVAAYMQTDKGISHQDVTAPLRALTRLNARFD